jgi:hypothetical protein
MKIAGFDGDTFREQGEVTIARTDGRIVTLKLKALPLGFEQTIAERIPAPSPPIGGALYGKDGKPIKDPQTGKIVPWFNEKEPAFIKAQAEANRLEMAAMIHMAVEGDENIRFDTPWTCQVTSDPKEWRTFYEGIFRELRDFGFSPGDMLTVVEEMMRLSRLDPASIEEAKKGFLRAVPAEESAVNSTGFSESARD